MTDFATWKIFFCCQQICGKRTNYARLGLDCSIGERCARRTRRGCFDARQPFIISQILRPYILTASRLFEKSCTPEVLLFLSPAVHVFWESFPLLFSGEWFFYLYLHDLSVRLDLIRIVLFLRWCARVLTTPGYLESRRLQSTWVRFFSVLSPVYISAESEVSRSGWPRQRAIPP